MFGRKRSTGDHRQTHARQDVLLARECFPHFSPASLPDSAAAGLQVIEIPDEMLVQAVTTAWEEGKSAFGPEWLGEGTLICSNAKLKATGTWMPRYTTAQAFAATVKALA